MTGQSGEFPCQVSGTQCASHPFCFDLSGRNRLIKMMEGNFLHRQTVGWDKGNGFQLEGRLRLDLRGNIFPMRVVGP